MNTFNEKNNSSSSNDLKRKKTLVSEYPIIKNNLLENTYLKKKSIIADYISFLRDLPRESRYPLSTYFLTESFVQKQLMTEKSSAVFMKKKYIHELPNFLKHCTIPYQGEEWILLFKDDDFEYIDILSNFFTEKIRITSNVKNRQSPYDFFYDNMDKVISNAIDYAIQKNIDLNSKAMSEGIFISGIKICTTFKISVGIAIFEQIFQSKRIFDPFAGWGDRALAAFMSKNVTYYKGIDVNSSLFPCYKHIQSFLNNLNPSKLINFQNEAIENVDFNEEIRKKDIDTIFSSPPFYDYEIYSNDMGQSTNQYKTKDSWLNDWFVPISVKMMSYLKKDGYFCYYLGGNDKDLFDTLYLGMRGPTVKFLGQIAVTNNSKRPLFLFVWKKI
jgi:16S rRNA G966 N2-methylase RsmD